MSTFLRYTFGNKAKEKKTLEKMLEEIELEDYRKVYLMERFLDILYDDFDIIAIKNKMAFQLLRFVALVSGVMVPIVANLNDNLHVFGLNKTAVITILGLLTSISFGFLQVFKNEKVWLHHRKTFEVLRTEGYKFLNLAGEYRKYESHGHAYPLFSTKLEDFIKEDIELYTQMVGSREKERREEE